jgi:predicted TPR repeat methyltransferase
LHEEAGLGKLRIGKGQGNAMDDEARKMLERAYALKDAGEALKLYRDWAANYDSTMLQGLGYLTPSRTAALLGAYLPDRRATVLDVGCGTGLAGVELDRLGFKHVDGLDFSAQMLAVARSRAIYAGLHEADLMQPLSLADRSYDAMICTGTFTHAHVGAACLPELFRVLKPGGLFACTVHKDVWREAGFAEMIANMALSGMLAVLYHQQGTYYSGSQSPEGWYCVWQRKAGS